MKEDQMKSMRKLMAHLIPAPITKVVSNKKDRRKQKFDYRKELQNF